VHSNDIADVFIAAWRAGATGIAVNGERITGSPACVGAVIQLNGTLLSPPFVVSILGPADQRFARLSDPLELRDIKSRHSAFVLDSKSVRRTCSRCPQRTGAGPIRECGAVT